MNALMLILNSVFCLGLMYAGFCRVNKTSIDTRWFVRWSLALRASAGFALLIAPFFWGQEPTWAILMLEAGCLATQISLRRLWENGPPDILSDGLRR